MLFHSRAISPLIGHFVCRRIHEVQRSALKLLNQSQSEHHFRFDSILYDSILLDSIVFDSIRVDSIKFHKRSKKAKTYLILIGMAIKLKFASYKDENPCNFFFIAITDLSDQLWMLSRDLIFYRIDWWSIPTTGMIWLNDRRIERTYWLLLAEMTRINA